jgi:hypothetical protein
VKAENPSACAMVNCKVCRSAIVSHFPVVLRCVNKVSINPNIQSKTCHIIHAQTIISDHMHILHNSE